MVLTTRFFVTADCGDYVVVTNAKNVQVSGNKAEQKVYYSHTMFPGGLKERKYKDLIVRKPDDVRHASLPHPSMTLRLLLFFSIQIIREAVSGMLPKNKLRERRLERLRIFAGDDMGPYRHNILKRWEDGTLPSETISRKS